MKCMKKSKLATQSNSSWDRPSKASLPLELDAIHRTLSSASGPARAGVSGKCLMASLTVHALSDQGLIEHMNACVVSRD